MPPTDSSGVSEWRTTAEWDWVEFMGGTVLHAVARVISEDDNECSAHVYTACNRGGRMWIPGLTMRMFGRRCKRCCEVTGMAYGIGSPKNDDALRPLVEARLAEVRR